MNSVILPSETTLKTVVPAVFEAAQQAHCAFALWRLPHQTQWQALVDFSEEYLPKPLVNLEETSACFVISPFVNPDLQGTFHLQPDWYFSGDDWQPMPELLTTKARKFKEIYMASEARLGEGRPRQIQFKIQAPAKEAFEQTVRLAVEAIQKGSFQKVVLSRTQEIDFTVPVEPVALFEKMSTIYPGAFVSLVYLPETGTWLGASPEVLVSVDKKHIFRTMALAGTQPYNPAISLGSASWTQKEIEEQALVSRYIINCFKKIRLREFEEEGPRTVVAGNLMHLRTDFWVDMQVVNYPLLATTMTNLLHPTSAVCGLPREASLEFILQHEPRARKLYSGFLGPVQFDEQIQLFVNLRCMQLSKQKATIYAGGGVTAHSDPNKEWAETVAKTQTMLNVLLT